VSRHSAARLARLEATAPAVDAVLTALDRALEYPNPGAYARACLQHDPPDHPWAAVLADISRRHPYRLSFKHDVNDDYFVAIEDALVLYKLAGVVQEDTDHWVRITIHAAARARLQLEPPASRRSRFERELWLEARPGWIDGAVVLLREAHIRDAARHEIQNRWFRSHDLLYPDTARMCELAGVELELLEMSVTDTGELHQLPTPELLRADVNREVRRLLQEARMGAFQALGSPRAEGEARALLSGAFWTAS
jgi:hypothetical protein